jgi:hypothetical protein
MGSTISYVFSKIEQQPIEMRFKYGNEEHFVYAVKQLQGHKERLKRFILCLGRFSGTEFSHDALDMASKLSPLLYLGPEADNSSKAQYM